MEGPARRTWSPGGVALGIVATGVILLATGIAEFALWAQAGGELGFFGEETVQPDAWWYGPSAVAVLVVAFGLAVLGFVRIGRVPWWAAVLLVPVAITACVVLAVAVWGT